MRRRSLRCSLVVASALVFVACGSSEKVAGPPNATGAAGAVGSSGAPSVNGGGPSLGFGGLGNSGATGIDSCVETSQSGKLVPLDLYLMLDASGSMAESTGSAPTDPSKWEAVQQALVAFLNDPESAGIGVGVQFFPLLDAAAPALCQSNAECGEFGPCFLKFCQTAGPGFFACDSASECVENGQDFGPCTPLRYCWGEETELIPCHDDFECDSGACVPFNECSGNTDYWCRVAGQACADENGRGIGTCRAFNPPSSCLNPTTCDVARYAAPAAAIEPLPAAAAGVAQAIAAMTPAGDTPTSAALSGALAQARSYAQQHTDHTVVALLATDGLPTECISDPAADPSGILGVAAVARAGLVAAPSIATFVIGVFGPEDVEARQNLDQIAVAGGTEAAFLVDTSANVTAQFLAALNAIRSNKLSCEYQLPDAPAGQALDFGRINVDFRSGQRTERLPAVADAGSCGAAGGWYYDVAPSTGAPSKILICPTTCARFEGASDASVQVALGCVTEVR